MSSARRLGSLFIVALLLISPIAAGHATELGDKTMLQATMRQHIESLLIDGNYLYLDPESATIRPLKPVSAHQAILRYGDIYILCADFHDEGGAAINVDFYLTRKDQAFVVFQTLIDDRTVLSRLMETGDVERVD